MKLIASSIKAWNIRREKDLGLKAASLTYYTVMSILTVCILYAVLLKLLNIDTDVSGMAEFILPRGDFAIDAVNAFVNATINSFYEMKWWELAVFFVVIIFSTNSFLNNIQRIFNQVWHSESRQLGRQVIINVIILFAFLVIVVVTSSITGLIPQLRLLWVSSAVFVSIFLSFRYLPYDKKPESMPASVAAVIATVLLSLFTGIFVGLVYTRDDGFMIDGINILFLLFWLYGSWSIILWCSGVCKFLDKSSSSYLYERIKHIPYCYKTYLSMFTASVIFRQSREQISRGYTFEEIRSAMLNNKSNADNQELNKPDSFLPMPLLDSIIEELVCHGVIKISKGSVMESDKNRVRYAVGDSWKDMAENVTVGDFLFEMLLGGCYDLRYPYYRLNIPLEETISNSLIATFANQNGQNDLFSKKLIDVKADKPLSANDKDKPKGLLKRQWHYLGLDYNSNNDELLQNKIMTFEHYRDSCVKTEVK